MVVNHNHIELKIGLLTEHAPDGVDDCSLAISHRYNNAGFQWKFFSRSGNSFESWFQTSADSLEVRRRNLLHFDLVIAVTRIHIVELLLACGTRVGSRCAVQWFGNPYDGMVLGNS